VKLATFTANGETKFGAKCDHYLIDLPGMASAYEPQVKFPGTLMEFLQMGDQAKNVAKSLLEKAKSDSILEDLKKKGLAFQENDITFLPPLQQPEKIICLGMNYRAHVQEMGRELPKYPTLFAKYANTLIGHKQAIVLPKISEMVDFEAELAIVIGKTCKDVSREDALTCIAGYTILNDVSVRDFQNRTLQWLQGKAFDGAGPIGPYLVTSDEIPNPDNLTIELRLNGEVMQHANTSDFIFDVRTIINYITQIMTLKPGDIISTGTPSGVGAARNPQVFLKAEDKVEISLQSVGTLENHVVANDDQNNNAESKSNVNLASVNHA
jgi:acylpyruvate hydrolase